MYVIAVNGGDYDGYLIINKHMKEKKKVSIKLSDWTDGPKYNEKIVASGYLKNKYDEARTKGTRTNIYMIKVPIDCGVYSLTLPECANLHIMKIQYEV